MTIPTEVIERLISLVCGDESSDVCSVAVRQLAMTMNDTCSECMADRKTIVLDPLCRGRFYLSLLIEAGVSFENIPRDCYEMRLDEISKIIAGRPVPVSTADSVIMLKDFMKILAKISGSKSLARKVEATEDPVKLMGLLGELLRRSNIDAEYAEADGHVVLVIFAPERPIICMLNRERMVAYVDLRMRRPSTDILSILVDILLRRYRLRGKIYVSSIGNAYLQLRLGENADIMAIKRTFPDLGMAILDSSSERTLSVRIVEEGNVVLCFAELLKLISMMKG